jgi:hypothetical protein
MDEGKATLVALGTSAAYVGREIVSAPDPNAPNLCLFGLTDIRRKSWLRILPDQR